MKYHQINISPYQLKLNSGHNLKGMLMAFEFDSQLKGYADFLPWPRFGEHSLSQEITHIKQGIQSERFLIAQKNAWLDAVARFQKQNLLYGLKLPPSHFLIEDILSFLGEQQILKMGYKYIKVKLKDNYIPEQIKSLKQLVKSLPKYFKWRLDFNFQKWSIWKDHLLFMKSQIDFIEDPIMDTCAEDWTFAEDWRFQNHFKIKIAKPARDSLLSLIQGVASARWNKIIFTHSFDHPLSQVVSAFWAAQFYKIYPSFFKTSGLKCLAFKDHPFYFHKSDNPFFSTPKGFGFGFDQQLKEVTWERLV